MSWLTCLDSFQNISALWVRFSYDFAFKSLLFLLGVFLVYQAARHLPSAFRHFVLSLAFFCLSILPVALICGPEWRFPFLSAPRFLGSAGQNGPGVWPFLLLGAWMVGLAAVLSRLTVGIWVTWRLKRESLLLDDPDWSRDVQTSSTRLGLRRKVPVLIHHRLGAAIAAGIIRPSVILPVAALEWSDEQRRTILYHELGHIKRRDNLTNLLSLVVCAVYWFNPLAWWAAARLRVCREAACDDLVLNCGTRPSRYVSYLLEATSTPPARLISVTLSQVSVLKKRLLTILDPHVNRRAIRPVQIVACCFFAATTLLSLSALQPWIVPGFTAGLSEKLGLAQLPGVRFASRLWFSPDGAEGRGALQTNPQSALLGLPPGFTPAGQPPVLPDRYPAQVINIGLAGNRATSAGAVASSRRSGSLAPVASSFAPGSQSAKGISYGPGVSRRTEPPPEPPPDPPPTNPDVPPASDPDDLKVTRRSLGTLGGALSVASDINEAGHVVGASTDAVGKSQPFVWSKSHGMADLPCPLDDCHAIDINNSGQVLLVATDKSGATSASYIWSPDGTLTNIGNLGGKSTRGLEINDQGRVIGAGESSLGVECAFFWTPEVGMINLGGSKAIAVNERGQVVGAGSSYAFFWDGATDTFLRIGELDVKAQPYDLNNQGEVVGYAHIGKNSQPKAFYWHPIDGMTEIEFPGSPVFSCAFRVNEAGEVLAITRDALNMERTYSWRPGQTPLEQSVPDFLVPQFDWQLMSASTSSSVGLIGSSVPSAKVAEELARVDFGAKDEPTSLAQPVRMNGRGQIAGNLVRPKVRESEAVLWEIRLPRVEATIRTVLGQLEGVSPSIELRLALNNALYALADNDYQTAASNLSTFLATLAASDSSIPATKRTVWIRSIQESLTRIGQFTVLE
ncbi:MAG: hypothetical protein EHM23_21485 [Acidobacteria bacterium]|nr:MAG: hypothetical protein EHM23_21485 [Acidobacteriota bacterium]